jgi:hypothetical protein
LWAAGLQLLLVTLAQRLDRRQNTDMRLFADAGFPIVYYTVPAYWLALVLFAFATEFLKFYTIQYGTASFAYAIISDGIANVCSAAVGVAVLWFIPGIVQNFERRRSTIVVTSLVLAWILSVAVEYGVLMAFPRWRKSRRSFAAVAFSNVMSYSVLGFGLLMAGLAG